MTHTNILLGTSMPITQKAIETANKFAAQQPNPQKAEQVYLNTLAVLAVNDYLQLMEIETNLAGSDSWNPVVRLCADIADLDVKGLGKLECRPVMVSCPQVSNKIEIKSYLGGFTPCTATPICIIPPEVWAERIGYVVVEIDENKKEATLLGFAKTAGAGELYLDRLQSVDALLEEIEKLTQPKVNLSQWFEDIFETGWQGIDDLIRYQVNPKLQFRNGASRKGGVAVKLFSDPDIVRAKLIDLGMQLGNKHVALIMALTQENEGKINIISQIHPAGGDRYLPSNLNFMLLSESGKTLQEVESKSMDLWMQLRPFRVASETNFSLKVELDDISITEAFTI